MTYDERKNFIRNYMKKNFEASRLLIQALDAYDKNEKPIRASNGQLIKRDVNRDRVIQCITANQYGVEEQSVLAAIRIIFCDGYISGYIDGESEANISEREYNEDDELVNCEFCGDTMLSSESYRDNIFSCLCIECLKKLHRRLHE